MTEKERLALHHSIQLEELERKIRRLQEQMARAIIEIEKLKEKQSLSDDVK